MTLKAGEVLAARYEVLCMLGKGGMGAVHRARSIETGRIVAIKELLPDGAEDVSQLERFRREASLLKEVLTTIAHPDLVEILDYRFTESERWIVLEYVEGESLADVLVREGPLPVGRALEFVRQVANAVGAMHSRAIDFPGESLADASTKRAIVHRDLKPGNLMVRKDGTICVVDLGIAKHAQGDQMTSDRLTALGMIQGTPCYMPAAAMLGEWPAPWHDVWALGIILYEMLTGHLPFGGRETEGPVGVFQCLAHWTGVSIRVERPAVPAIVESLLNRLLDPNPATRLSDGAAAAAAIEGVQVALVAGEDAPAAASLGCGTARGAVSLGCRGQAEGAGVMGRARGDRSRVERAGETLVAGPVARCDRGAAQTVAQRGRGSDSLSRGARSRTLVWSVGGIGGTLAVLTVALALGHGRVQGVRTPGPVVSVASPGPSPGDTPSVRELATELTRRLQAYKGRLNGVWLTKFAVEHKATLKRDPKGVSEVLRKHFEVIGLMKPLTEFLLKTPAYFEDARIPEAERWATRSALCDVELIEYFCEENKVPWPLGVKVSRCAGRWDAAVEVPPRPSTNYVKFGVAGDDTKDVYFGEGTYTYSYLIPSRGTIATACLWFATTEMTSGYVIEASVNERHRIVLHAATTTPSAPPIWLKCDRQDIEGGGQVWQNDRVGILCTNGDEGRRRYLGRAIPPGCLLPGRANRIRIGVWEIPGSRNLRWRKPAVWSKILSIEWA
ncbi:MAG: serine/threonine protein kinase [Candidatus Riflebacteria bacterium]|nr:serine/threonine protein kinase [Candidatus Riflebacteria bacterium]